ncbi:MAG: hypothetical protein QF921_06525 [Pseudomonadales bacterium]|jgi:2-polyprenyl-6-methoxyphenol hydroxylase-like FAD-dependent oxidoreductase|nr:hypothetical protein [Pseudomonadales bacterium]MDP6469491.1 hypothetical protein [Pseudomonadales bacterium]MDP6827333.1 hypothetical protein [Pseudomonadales bacterium]MDP6971156.1 hypothetical protein [Pseudomonadales bacterium]
MIGAGAALAAAHAGFSVTLIERDEPAVQPGRLGMELRTVTLLRASRQLLQTLGVGDAHCATPYTGMRV